MVAPRAVPRRLRRDGREDPPARPTVRPLAGALHGEPGRSGPRDRSRGLVHRRRREAAGRSRTVIFGGRSTRPTPRSSTTSATSATKVRGWGVDMVKLDFLYQGAQEGTRHDSTDHRHAGAAARPARVRRSSSATTSTCSAAARRCCRWSASATRTASATTSRCPCSARSTDSRCATTGPGGRASRPRPARPRPAGRRTAAGSTTIPRSSWRGAATVAVDPTATRSRSPTPRPSSRHSSAGRSCSRTSSSTLLPEERAVLEDPAVLDLAWDERGFRPLDLFDHADDRSSPRLRPARRSRVGLGRGPRRAAPSSRCSTGPTHAADRTAPDGTTIAIPPHGARLLPG